VAHFYHKQIALDMWDGAMGQISCHPESWDVNGLNFKFGIGDPVDQLRLA
jgi:hypothetical protein